MKHRQLRVNEVVKRELSGIITRSVINKLEEHRVALQTELSRRVVLKYTPHLVFHLDTSIERGARVIEIMQEIETPQDKE